VAFADPDSSGRSGAATCGGQASTGLTAPTGLGGPDPSPQEGVRCHHVPPPCSERGWRCHVPVAEGGAPAQLPH
jgi:hypothetical protein